MISTVTENNIETTLNNLCSTFSLSASELIAVSKATSQENIDGWLNGAIVPMPSTIERLFVLGIITDAWLSSAFPKRKKSFKENSA